MDEDLVRAWCAARRIPLCVGTGDVAAYAGENGLTIEEAARKLRYDFLNSVAGQTGAARGRRVDALRTPEGNAGARFAPRRGDRPVGRLCHHLPKMRKNG